MSKWLYHFYYLRLIPPNSIPILDITISIYYIPHTLVPRYHICMVDTTYFKQVHTWSRRFPRGTVDNDLKYDRVSSKLIGSLQPPVSGMNSLGVVDLGQYYKTCLAAMNTPFKVVIIYSNLYLPTLQLSEILTTCTKLFDLYNCISLL